MGDGGWRSRADSIYGMDEHEDEDRPLSRRDRIAFLIVFALVALGILLFLIVEARWLGPAAFQ